MSELLNESARHLLTWISQLEKPYSQQALALLALDEGVTQVEAGRRSGLSARQVRYIRDKFQQQGVEMFPHEVVAGVYSSQSKDSPESRLNGWVYETESQAGENGSSEQGEIIYQDIQDESSSEKAPKGKKAKKAKKQKKGKAEIKKKKKKKNKKGKKKSKAN